MLDKALPTSNHCSFEMNKSYLQVLANICCSFLDILSKFSGSPDEKATEHDTKELVLRGIKNN